MWTPKNADQVTGIGLQAYRAELTTLNLKKKNCRGGKYKP